MARFWVGTSGWHYSHWRGEFYPEDLSPREWLSYYAQRFPTVELNASFYRQPKTSAWELWRKTAPRGFRFAVKASRFLTHIRRLADPEEPLDRVLSGARLLGDRLGPLLYQLPPGFHRTPENLARLEAFLPLLPGDVLHAIEFRHRSWFVDETAELLRRHSVAFCSFDMVGLKCPLLATARFAYMRFHGSEALYASNYTDEMLEGWAARLRDLSQEVDELYIYFNNDAWGYAVANARALTGLLDVELPSP
jgi:uncharacterized protein YecE (DUF72 family)